MKVEAIAKACHEVNKGLCTGLGDDSQLSWDEAPDWQRDSAVHGVEAVRDQGPDPERTHISWLQEKLDAGWPEDAVRARWTERCAANQARQKQAFLDRVAAAAKQRKPQSES